MDLRRTRIVHDRPGPFLTVHVEVGGSPEGAGRRVEERWRTLRHDLEKARVDRLLIDDIGDRFVEDLRLPGAARRTVVATEDGVVLDEVQVGESEWPETTELFAPLPDLAGWLWSQARVGTGPDDDLVADLRARVRRRRPDAVHGVHEVLEALVRDRVERVVMDLRAAREHSVRPAEHDGLVLPAAAAVRDVLPADRVVVAMAAATDTDLCVLPLEPGSGGVAAMLRPEG